MIFGSRHLWLLLLLNVSLLLRCRRQRVLLVLLRNIIPVHVVNLRQIRCTVNILALWGACRHVELATC